MKLLVPDDAPLTLDPAPEGVQVHRYDPAAPLPPELLDAEYAVVWGFAGPVLDQLATAMPRLRWVQAMSAGPDALLAAGLPEAVQISVGRGFHDLTVTEHAVALTLAATTGLPHYAELQRRRVWDSPGFRPLHVPDRLATIVDAQVLIWGFGSIGQQMAPVFTDLGARVRGVATTEGERGGYPCFSEDALPELLPQTDVLVMVLPHSPETTRALNAERLALLKPTSWVVNVGRGTCVDEDALVAALHAGRLGGAALDVAATEPLPADSPLWDAPRTILTPHVAGGRPIGVEEAVRRNLALLARGEAPEQLARR